MDKELDQLMAQAERLLDLARRLGEENAMLRARLAETQGVQSELQSRMQDARVRIEQALARMPVPGGQPT